MKMILFFTFAVGLFATSNGAVDPSDIGYSLALGPLEFFLSLGTDDISKCYEENKNDYENSIIIFSSLVSKMRNSINDAGLPTQIRSSDLPKQLKNLGSWGMNTQEVLKNSRSLLKSNTKNYILWCLDLMDKIASSLNDYFTKLKKDIFNGRVVEGGSVVCEQRSKIEGLYIQFLKCGKDIKDINGRHYEVTFPFMNRTIRAISRKSYDLSDKLLECFEKKNISLIKKN